MPRDSGGNYSLPPNYLAIPGQTIRTEQHNPPLEDLAQAMTQSLPRDGRAGMVGPLDMGTFPIRNVAAGVAATDVANVGQASVPIGSVIDFAGANAPAGWFFCAGQALSRTTYSELFAVIGTSYGAGNGSTTFNLPDLRGRVPAGRDDMNGTNANRLSTVYGAAARTLGGSFGNPSYTLALTEIPSHNHTGVTGTAGQHAHTGVTTAAGNHDHGGTTSSNGNHSHSLTLPTSGVVSSGNSPILGPPQNAQVYGTSAAGEHTHIIRTDFSGNHQHGIVADGNHNHSIAAQGGGQAHPIAQPTFIINKIIKASI